MNNIQYVVHCKKAKYDVYVGRPSKFGNPFTYKEGTTAPFICATREECIQKFEEWLLAQPELVAAAKAELKGKTLACWCHPLSCHADVLARIANEENSL